MTLLTVGTTLHTNFKVHGNPRETSVSVCGFDHEKHTNIDLLLTQKYALECVLFIFSAVFYVSMLVYMCLSVTRSAFWVNLLCKKTLFEYPNV